jgi:hypothetical protein
MVCWLVTGNTGCQRPGPQHRGVPRRSGCSHSTDSRRPPGGWIARHPTRSHSRDRHLTMKRESLLRHMRLHGCYLKREGGRIRFGAIRLPGRWKRCRDTRNWPIFSREKFAAACRYLNSGRSDLWHAEERTTQTRPPLGEPRGGCAFFTLYCRSSTDGAKGAVGRTAGAIRRRLLPGRVRRRVLLPRPRQGPSPSGAQLLRGEA